MSSEMTVRDEQPGDEPASVADPRVEALLNQLIRLVPVRFTPTQDGRKVKATVTYRTAPPLKPGAKRSRVRQEPTKDRFADRGQPRKPARERSR
jgi:hypothetical protein